ncbi:MAG: arginine--tRNA ligase [Clostridiales bacterium]|nr:arginine--tRNA ligase [Clostridiales bacterium]
MIEKKLEEILNKVIKECFNEDFCTCVHSSNKNCDYQCDDCFSLSKTLKNPPFKIAEIIVNKLKEDKSFSKIFKNVEFAHPGFINFILTDEFIDNCLEKMSESEKFGVESPLNPKVYFLDYGGPNIAKPLHVGHLRSPIIGESVKRIVNFSGNKTISDVHFGDYGLQIGEVIYGLKEKNISKENITLELLQEIYPDINARIKIDDNLNSKCAEITKELQEGNKEYHEYFEIIREISKNDILRLYDYLDIKFDLYEGESNSYEYIDELTELLNSKNLLIESQGAKVIDIRKEDDKKELPPLIYQKSNGAYLYGTTDMASVLERIKKFKPDNFIYFADIRQDLHFNQFFRAISKTGIINENQFEFYGFGTVNGLDGKPYKTREGNSPTLDSLFNQVKTLLLKNKEMDLEKPEDIDKIVNSVIKFADLQNNYEKDYIFDIEKFSKTEGKTGPYLLYSYVRLNKVLNKFNESLEPKFNGVNKNEIEREIKLKLLSFPKIFNRSFVERKPHYLADYVYDLSTKLNAFYEQNRFSDSENEKYLPSWLKLIDISLKLEKTILKLLVIDTVQKM